MSDQNQATTQAVVVSQSEPTKNQTSIRLALFNENGNPITLSSGGDSGIIVVDNLEDITDPIPGQLYIASNTLLTFNEESEARGLVGQIPFVPQSLGGDAPVSDGIANGYQIIDLDSGKVWLWAVGLEGGSWVQMGEPIPLGLPTTPIHIPFGVVPPEQTSGDWTKGTATTAELGLVPYLENTNPDSVADQDALFYQVGLSAGPCRVTVYGDVGDDYGAIDVFIDGDLVSDGSVDFYIDEGTDTDPKEARPFEFFYTVPSSGLALVEIRSKTENASSTGTNLRLYSLVIQTNVEASLG